MRKWNSLLVIITLNLLVSLMPITTVQAEGTVYEKYGNQTQQDETDTEPIPVIAKESVVPYALKFIGSFLLILLLLFIVLKYLAKKSKQISRGGPFHPLGGHSLGNNRSIQMVMIGNTVYIVGVGEDVNLLRAVPPGEEQRSLLESAAEQPLDTVSKWGAQLKKTSQEKWNEHLQKQLKEIHPQAKEEQE